MTDGELAAALAGNASPCPSCGTPPPSHAHGCPHQSRPLPTDPLLGTTVAGAFHITRVLGEGGMGRVYEARHTRIPSRRFALKTLHPEYAKHAAVLARFQREAEAAASIRSPHVVEIYDVNRLSDGRPCMVGEYLEGKQLGEHLAAAGRMPIIAAVQMVRQVCRGLAAAHVQGIVHRDIKPENIFLTGDPAYPTVKILDFGISKVDDSAGLTKTGMVMGTPAYMAPEQARGERVDHRADIYAVGVVLYHAVTGRPPFDRGDPAAMLVAVMTEEPPPPRSLNPDVPPELEVVLQRTMAKAAQARYASMDELEGALAPFDDGSATAPPAPTPIVVGPGRPSAFSYAFGLPASPAAHVGFTRRLVVLLGMVGLGWLGAGLVSAVGGLLRASSGDAAALSGSTAAWLTLGVVVALSGAAALCAWRLRRHAWRDGDMLGAIGARLTAPIALGLGAYGFASLLVRLLDGVLLQEAIGMAWPVWDALLFLISLGVAGGVVLFRSASATS